MRQPSSALSLGFSCVGHALMHMFTAMYAVIVVAMGKAGWSGMSYGELLGLWTLGSFLVGAAAIPAGWLGDRWSAVGMMVIFFVGMGAASIVCGLVDGPSALFIGLAAIGLFAAIYHPVGIAWLVKTSEKRGRALGFNGIFGVVGVSSAALVSGILIDLFSWRAAFIVPGALSVSIGLALLICWRLGLVADAAVARPPQEKKSRGEAVRVYLILLCTMTCMGLIFQATQTAIPKLFDIRLGALLDNSALGVSLLVSAVYTTGGIIQIAGGYLADRMPLKPLYIGCFMAQILVMAGIASIGGFVLLPVAAMAVLLATGPLPAENMLLARYTPEKHQGLAYGLKFVLSFGVAPIAIAAVAWVKESTGEFTWLFLGLAAVAGVAALAASLLPREGGPKAEALAASGRPQPAE